MAKRLPRLKLDWSDDGTGAVGPDGTRYMIGSEQVRGEPRSYHAMVEQPGVERSMGGGSGTFSVPRDFPDEREVFPAKETFYFTKKQIARWCEIDAHRRTEAAGGLCTRDDDKSPHLGTPELHACILRAEIYDDDEPFCNCCDECVADCALEV